MERLTTYVHDNRKISVKGASTDTTWTSKIQPSFEMAELGSSPLSTNPCYGVVTTEKKDGLTSVNHQTYAQELLYEEPENLASKSMVTPACNHPPKATSEKSTRCSQEQERRGIIAGRGRPALLIIALILTTVVIASASAAITVLLFQRPRPSTQGRILVMNWLEVIFIFAFF